MGRRCKALLAPVRSATWLWNTDYLAEEWHTVSTVLHLDWLLRQAQVRPQVTILWNANNTFGFEQIAWQRLTAAATLTTVSR